MPHARSQGRAKRLGQGAAKKAKRGPTRAKGRAVKATPARRAAIKRATGGYLR